MKERATEYDGYFEGYYEESKKVGMKVGALWNSYATSISDAVEEEKFFIKGLARKQFEYPIYYEINDDSIALGIQNEIVEKFCSIFNFRRK